MSVVDLSVKHFSGNVACTITLTLKFDTSSISEPKRVEFH